jgi:hypothetical protein
MLDVRKVAARLKVWLVSDLCDIQYCGHRAAVGLAKLHDVQLIMLKTPLCYSWIDDILVLGPHSRVVEYS